jgi:hypothetical protein
MLSKCWMMLLLRLHKLDSAASNLVRYSVSEAIRGNKTFTPSGEQVAQGRPVTVGDEPVVDRHMQRMTHATAGWGSSLTREDKSQHKAAFLLACEKILQSGGDAALLEVLDNSDLGD